jgi:hypothetical protein
VILDLPVLMVQLVQLVLMEPTVLTEPMVLMELTVLTEPMVLMELTVLMEHQVNKVFKV